MNFETTVKVEFNSAAASSADYLIIAELDDILNVDSSGEAITSFGVDDTPWFRFHASSNIRLDVVVSTDGGVLPKGTSAREISSQFLFSSRDPEKEDSYVYPVVPNSVKTGYVGRVGDVVIKSLAGGRRSITGNSSLTPFLMNLDMTYAVKLFQLIPPALELDEDETYNIFVVFYVTLLED